MKKSESKTLTFLRRNAVYFILAFCILAVGLSLTLILTAKKTPIDQGQIENPLPDTPTPDTPVDNPVETPVPDTPVDNPVENPVPDAPVETVITFAMPVASAKEITEYSETVVYNSTLNRFSAHKAIDFYADEGTQVFAVFGGTVEKVENSPLLTGVTVVIDHGNGLKTVYNSLADMDDVSVGQTVAKGQKIGEVSVTNRQEYKEGAHLHFEVMENGESINPAKYLTFNEK